MYMYSKNAYKPISCENWCERYEQLKNFHAPRSKARLPGWFWLNSTCEYSSFNTVISFFFFFSFFLYRWRSLLTITTRWNYNWKGSFTVENQSREKKKKIWSQKATAFECFQSTSVHHMPKDVHGALFNLYKIMWVED